MHTETLENAMALVADMNEKHGIKVQGGKKYTQVVNRVEAFRKHFGLGYGFLTEIKPFGSGVLVTASIVTPDSFIISQGNAFATAIQKEKSLEKLETTAIGRALAGIGLGGGEYASAEEIDSYEERYFEFTRDHKIMQRDFLYGLGDCKKVEEVDSYLEAWKEDLESGPEQVTGYMKDSASARREALEKGVEHAPAKFGFVDVKEALNFMNEVQEQLKANNLTELNAWFADNDHKLKALDTTLSAKKYETQEGSPYQRAINAYTRKINELKKPEAAE